MFADPSERQSRTREKKTPAPLGKETLIEKTPCCIETMRMDISPLGAMAVSTKDGYTHPTARGAQPSVSIA